MPVRNNLWSLASLFFLVFAAWQGVATLSRAPAFNRSLQAETADGGAIPHMTKSMYSRANYHFWIARGWHAGTYDAALPGDVGSPEHDAARLRRFGKVRNAATESLRHNPGNPAAWMLVAKAEAARGEGAAALAAWRVSHDLAPHSALNATERMSFLIRFMSSSDGRTLALETIPAQDIDLDLQAMRVAPGSRGLAERFSEMPAIAVFERD